MCGIVGIVAYKDAAPVDREELRIIRDFMRPRGPDGEGEWFSPDMRVGLGQRRLAIIDLSPSGAQPMENAEGTRAIIFNGEIYNYRVLRQELESHGRVFRSHSDTEVLLQLYEQFGPSMVHKLRGMFAFAIWDSVRQGIFMARDPFGIKPLYYADDGKTLRFASQVKALLKSRQIDISAEAAGHVGFFLWGYVPDPFTLYRGIRALTAGTSMWVGFNGEKEIIHYQDAANFLANPSPSICVNCEQEKLELCQSTLADSVRHHLIADIPVGVFLSSGLDSSALTAIASAETPQLRTVTLGFEEYRGTELDETIVAQQISDRFHTNHQTVWIGKKDFERHREKILESMDRPSIDGINSYFVSLAAKTAGLKVALSGLGGDELFGSYPSFRDVPRLAKIIPSFARKRSWGQAFRKLSVPVFRSLTSPKYASLFEYGGSYPGAYLLRRALYLPWELDSFLDAELIREGLQDLRTMERLEKVITGIKDPQGIVTALEMSCYMRYQLLRDSDWAGMAHSVEIRVPFVDKEVVTTVAGMMHQGFRCSKLDMARAIKPALPKSVVERRKRSFSVPIRQWIASESPSKKDRHSRRWACHIAQEFDFLSPNSSEFRNVAYGGNHSSSFRSATNSLQRVRPGKPRQNRILIYRIAQLGDLIVSLPAMSAIRGQFPDAHIALLCEYRPNGLKAWTLLDGTGIVDRFESYPVGESLLSRWLRPLDFFLLFVRLRKGKYDTLVYLAPSIRTKKQIDRDRRFFQASGITRFIGFERFPDMSGIGQQKPLPAMPHEADLLLRRLEADRIQVPAEGCGRMDMHLGAAEESAVRDWLRKLPSDSGRSWIAIGPGSKMPSKMWPVDRYATVVRHLINRYDIWPVVFGGPADERIGERLLREWQRGYNACGRLDLRASAAAIKRTILYLGNDTGTMHMANAVGVPCVALFAARESPGQWYPYLEPRHVFRRALECEGCQLVVCAEKRNECLKGISAEEVTEVCCRFLPSAIGNMHPRLMGSPLQN
jgi:asparagine synthase (glutamine-hydrolysing)